jgi:hypothetical protein
VPVCTLLTDFGSADYYVAAVKGVLSASAPGAALVDLGHDVAPGDVEGGAWLLAAAARWYPPGTVHLAVVDPGVGSDRRILAVRAGGMVFVGPDNGLLLPAAGAVAAAASGGVEARAVGRDDLFLPGPGATFHGRDRFAPIAAWLLAGGAPADLGPAISDPVRLALPAPRRDGPAGAAGTVLVGRVAWIDRFGNLVTDLPAAWLGGRPCHAETAGHSTGHRAGHYREIPAGEAAVLPGSLGTLELSLDGDSLARRWGVRRGDPVTVRLR